MAPGPLIIARQLKNKNLDIQEKILTDKNLEELLLQEQYSMIFTNQPIDNPKIDNIYLGQETLIVNLNEFTPLANQMEVKFSDLKGMSFVVWQEIGVWKDLIQKEIPDAKFLYQNIRENFDEVRNYSIFPYFTTNMTQIDSSWNTTNMVDRMPVHIKDESATITFYASFLSQNKKRLLPIINSMQEIWEKVD